MKNDLEAVAEEPKAASAPAVVLKAWRAAQGYSQEKGAVVLGVKVRTLQAWEGGRRPLPAIWALVEPMVLGKMGTRVGHARAKAARGKRERVEEPAMFETSAEKAARLRRRWKRLERKGRGESAEGREIQEFLAAQLPTLTTAQATTSNL